MTLSPKQLASAVIILVFAGIGSYLYKDASFVFVGMGIVSIVALLMGAGAASGPSVEGLGEAMRRATNGERSAAPAAAPPPLARVYDELTNLADRRKRELESLAT